MSPTLYIRIYLIPYDLENVKGKLRMRDEAVLVQARRYMRSLLSELVIDDHNWDAEPMESMSARRHFLDHSIDNRTMAEIYSDLPSPETPVDDSLHNIPGMCSTLYSYQRQSVATMLARELHPPLVSDPLYIPISGIDGDVFFLQPATMEILRECPQVEQARGGILCEELGTGKTVMMLGLILATLNQLPCPEESILDERPILTPLSLRHFPSPECVLARKRLSSGHKSNKLKTSGEIPSLVELLVHYCRVQPDGLRIRESQDELEQRRLWAPIIRNTPFYFQFDVPIDEDARPRRRKVDPGPKVMYLSTATLVIVPANLLAQWENETMKHCHDVLRLLALDSRKPIPCASELASNFDIILITQARFSAEAQKNNISKLQSWRVCGCRAHANGPRVPRCRCESPTDVSPLLQIRWKRLIIDEGHVAASLVTNITPFAKALSVERRWIVTGTPTTNLLGLHFGQGSELQYPADEHPEDTSEILDTDESDVLARKWTKDDREDLNKLANMVIHFLGVPMFSQAAGTRPFNTHVIQPLMESSGPRPGAICVLTQVMSMIMIRHRIEDVERDVLLPLLRQETIALDLDPYAIKSYNALQAGIAINAVDSERSDQDYLFHRQNAEMLKVTIMNMSEVLFWHVDSERLFNVDEMVERSANFMETMQKRNTSIIDIKLMTRALEHVRIAAVDPIWRSLQAQPDVLHRISGMPKAIYEVCTVLPASTFSSDVYLITSERLIDLRKFLYLQPLARTERIIEWAQHANEELQHRIAFAQETMKVTKRARKPSSSKQQLMMLKQGESKEKKDEMHKEWEAVRAKLKALAEDDGYDRGNHMSSRNGVEDHSLTRRHGVRARFLSSSPLAGMQIGNSTSSKLNYILNEVGQFASTEKFLIFSNSPATLNLVREGLELIEVKYLVYTGLTPLERVTPKEREQRVTTFETSDTYRVFLMELKYGARGLNLVAASRVIFCEPVWQADVESQAVKRVHRIGQTRPVTVKTLAIRNTYEEVMVTRREALKAGNSKQPGLTDDRRMRDFIANPTFLSSPASTTEPLDLPFLDIPRGRTERSEQMASPPVAHRELSCVNSCGDVGPLMTKKSRVLFADEVEARTALELRPVDIVKKRKKKSLLQFPDTDNESDEADGPSRKKVHAVRFADDSLTHSRP
ncbi:hypothetical protein SCP_1900140 [Sparassis crispa]|uniref:Helicase C-terminal domain-containing protein n=1 Tax=Sparassis crispa TaxID=139825 RepID=A0A401H6V9_9APHY|nr:hypothetical protein SCP_1900140 [Sparassis crispa]GBE90165.1 hypothetical protein SCP_1900140 [Sparassis crispa]